jgi:predicted transcriptional regulator
MMSLKTRRRRDRFTIVRDILSSTAEKGVIRMTHLMFETGINHYVLGKYINMLQRRGFIVVQPGDAVNRKNVEITEKGYDMLDALQRYIQLRNKLVETHYEIMNSLFVWGGND